MKILLSAYACEPGKGSEPGVGWNWHIELAKYRCELYVLTRSNNKDNIESVLGSVDLSSVKFIYYDLPDIFLRFKSKQRFVRTYYWIWQYFAFVNLYRIYGFRFFDIVHHITFGVYRTPSLMFLLGKKFIFGPVGGAENFPVCFLSLLSMKGIAYEVVRYLSNKVSLFNIFSWVMYLNADRIYAKTRETKDAIPSCFHFKTIVTSEIGIVSSECGIVARREDSCFKFLYVGRLIELKGLVLAVKAFAKHLKNYPGSTLTFVGSGDDEPRLRRLAAQLKITESIIFVGWVEKDSLAAIYDSHNAFIFPSLHDSSGNVILEAFSYGLPVICLDLGGPASIVDSSCGMLVPVYRKTVDEVVDLISDSMSRLVSDGVYFSQLVDGAFAKAKAWTWGNSVAKVYGGYFK